MSSGDMSLTYDVIICGGGTAGCVLASRLSEDPELKVLMIEAGEDANDDPRISTPGLFPTLFDDPDRDWQFLSEPNSNLNGRRIAHARGKCIGGSSAINLMAMVYPSKHGLDTWAELGNPGWDYDSMLPYYRKFQTHCTPSDDVASALMLDYLSEDDKSTQGPIKVSFPASLDPLHQAWVDSWEAIGRRGNAINGRGIGGFTTPASVDPRTGKRSFSGSEYYGPAKERANLDVITNTVVERIETSTHDEKVRATGVTLRSAGKSLFAKASKEVLLCAGTFGSPQILELSGIACSRRSASLGIPSVIDNPNVGENLQDHLMCGPSFEVKDGVVTADVMRDASAQESVTRQYAESASGPLASGAGYSFAYTPLVDFIPPLDPADLTKLLDQHLPATWESKSEQQTKQDAFRRRVIESPNETSAALCFFAAQFNGAGSKTSDVFALSQPENYVTILTQLAHPFSRGSVHVNSAEPGVKPKINTNYFSHPLDVEIMARHLLQCEALAEVPPLKAMRKPGGRRLPDGQDARSVERAIEMARSNATTNYHPCGTCAMLSRESGGVVNEKLIVHGTSNLRVIDASIFPIIPRGNIQTTVYATAEKGADLVRSSLEG